jgi:hypothetical protein
VIACSFGDFVGHSGDADNTVEVKGKLLALVEEGTISQTMKSV